MIGTAFVSRTVIDVILNLFRTLNLESSIPRANAWSNLEVFWIAFIHSRPFDISYHLLSISAATRLLLYRNAPARIKPEPEGNIVPALAGRRLIL